MAKTDVIIVGGGIMGCTLALRFAQAGLSPVVLERSVPGAEASSAAAGILGPSVEAHAHDTSFRFALESRERHAQLAEELRETFGLEVGFRRCGVLRTAFTEGELQVLKAHHDALGTEADGELLSAEQVRALEPSLNPEVIGGVYFKREAQLEPRRLLSALAMAAERAGARFESGLTVRGVESNGGNVQGVRHDQGRMLASHVIVAAGSWTTRIAGLPLRPDAIVPVRGQILRCHARPAVFERIVFGAGGYVVPRANGEVLCGSTEEHAGFKREVTLGGLASVIDIATRLAPSLAAAPVDGYWSNFRPGTPDHRPLIGETDRKGLWVASGHFRNGILLAPATADLVVNAIINEGSGSTAFGTVEQRTEYLSAFDPMRFQSSTEELDRILS